LIEWIGGRQDPVSNRSWTMRNIYLRFLNFTGNYSYQPKTFGGQVFGFFFAFWAMLVTAAATTISTVPHY